jgi:hypothetical protein
MRDYDKEPIVIRDYGMFADVVLSIVIIFCLVVFASYKLYIGIYIDKNFTYINIGVSCIFITFLLVSVFIIFQKEVKKNLSFFKFTNDKINYRIFRNNKNPNYTEVFDERTAYNKYMKRISFCIMSEPRERYGRKHYLSSWGLFRKSTIAIPLEKLLEFIFHFIKYLLILPFKIHKLKKAREPLFLLKKNIVIEFTNRNYFIVNIYSQKELDELMRYFASQNVFIDNKTVFLHHWHVANKYWINKEETWCDEYEPKEIKKIGMWQKIAKLFGDRKGN